MYTLSKQEVSRFLKVINVYLLMSITEYVTICILWTHILPSFCPSLLPLLVCSYFMDAKCQRIYKEFSSITTQCFHLKYSHLKEFCAFRCFPLRVSVTSLLHLFLAPDFES